MGLFLLRSFTMKKKSSTLCSKLCSNLLSTLENVYSKFDFLSKYSIVIGINKLKMRFRFYKLFDRTDGYIYIKFSSKKKKWTYCEQFKKKIRCVWNEIALGIWQSAPGRVWQVWTLRCNLQTTFKTTVLFGSKKKLRVDLINMWLIFWNFLFVIEKVL